MIQRYWMSSLQMKSETTSRMGQLWKSSHCDLFSESTCIKMSETINSFSSHAHKIPTESLEWSKQHSVSSREPGLNLTKAQTLSAIPGTGRQARPNTVLTSTWWCSTIWKGELMPHDLPALFLTGTELCIQQLISLESEYLLFVLTTIMSNKDLERIMKGRRIYSISPNNHAYIHITNSKYKKWHCNLTRTILEN